MRSVAIKGKRVRNRRGPATVSGEPSPCLYGSHWETSREGWATALSHEGGDSAIVRAVVTVAKSLNMAVTAEGIETDQQRLELKALGCDLGQGFLFGRPTTPEHLKPLLAVSMNGALVGA